MFPLRLYFKDRFVLAISITWLILAIFSWWYVLSKVPKNADQVFLHYNIIFGVDLAGAWWKLLIMPGGVSAMLLVNSVLTWALFGRDRVLGKIVLLGGFLASILATMAMMLIVGLNV